MTLLSFESSDSLAQFTVWIVPVAGGGLVSLLTFDFAGWLGVLACILIVVALVVGLRSSISVTDTEVVLVKKWFFVPYRTYRAPFIDDVWFGGDYGLEDGAMGVVVKLGVNEVHIGTSKNMCQLHAALWPHSAQAKKLQLNSRPGENGHGKSA